MKENAELKSVVTKNRPIVKEVMKSPDRSVEEPKARDTLLTNGCGSKPAAPLRSYASGRSRPHSMVETSRTKFVSLHHATSPYLPALTYQPLPTSPYLPALAYHPLPMFLACLYSTTPSIYLLIDSCMYICYPSCMFPDSLHNPNFSAQSCLLLPFRLQYP